MIIHLPTLIRQIYVSFMKPLTEREIRDAFVNCIQGEAKRLHVPRDLADQPWDDLGFLGSSNP